MRNRKPSSGCLLALPAEVGSLGGRRCADTLLRLFSPGILAGTLIGSNIWKRRGGERNPTQSQNAPPRPLKKATLQVEKYDGLAAERVVTFRSVQEETGSP